MYNPAAPKTNKIKPKNLINIQFVNKGMDMINITKIINDENVKENLPTKLTFNSTKQNKVQQYMH